MVRNEHCIDVVGLEIQPCQPFLELNAAESLVDQHLCRWRFQQGRVPPTAGAKVRDGHRHANISTPTREGLEHTDETNEFMVILGAKSFVQLRFV